MSTSEQENDIADALKTLETDIAEIVKQIKVVEVKIDEFDAKIADTDEDEQRRELRVEKKRLHRKEEQLHRKEEQLRDEKKRLHDEKKQLRDERLLMLRQQQPQYAINYPKTPRNQGIRGNKPSTPPRNGIGRAAIKLRRMPIVSSILSRAKPIVIIRSPPATGKTSLLDLIEEYLTTEPNTIVVRFSLYANMEANTNDFIAQLKKETGLAAFMPKDLNALCHDIWILIDDAQLAFKNECFWKVVIKDVETASSERIHVVIAGTYDLVSQGSTPFLFTNYPHVDDLRLTDGEAGLLYDGYVNKLAFADRWIAFKDTLLKLSSGHVGVLTAGIAMLHLEHSYSQKRWTQEEALDALRGSEFRKELRRCFPCNKLMTVDQKEAVAATILNGPTSTRIGTENSSDPSVQLIRAGILSSYGTFSCLVASWFYYNQFDARPTTRPKTLSKLIRQSVKSMSALRLRQSCDPFTSRFPKEAAFQQLFNEAMTMLLPPTIAVCPELNTFARNNQGHVVTGELDFFINGELGWAIELLRLGHKIGEHMERFDPRNGKYRTVPYKDYLVVDCRGPRTNTAVTPSAERCTLYFAKDFKTVEVIMRLREPLILHLQE